MTTEAEAYAKGVATANTQICDKELKIRMVVSDDIPHERIVERVAKMIVREMIANPDLERIEINLPRP